MRQIRPYLPVRTGVARRYHPAVGGVAGTRMGLTRSSPDDLRARPLARLELWILVL
jgi:hypothetical protein